MEAASDQLQRWWKEIGGPVPVRRTESEVAALEDRYNISIPESFRNYLLTTTPADGTEEWDDECTCWWPVGRIKNIPEELADYEAVPPVVEKEEEYLVFADYCVWCDAWAIACTQDSNRGRIMTFEDREDPFVADSFEQFVEDYIQQAKRPRRAPTLSEICDDMKFGISTSWFGRLWRHLRKWP